MKKGKELLLFCLGGTGYVGLELLWRGRSHSSMFLAGGSCFLLLGRFRGKLERLAVPVRAVACSGIITAVELATGLVFNRDHRVWDYRDLPANFLGQICLPFSILWAPLGLGGMELYHWVEKGMERKIVVCRHGRRQIRSNCSCVGTRLFLPGNAPLYCFYPKTRAVTNRAVPRRSSDY